MVAAALVRGDFESDNDSKSCLVLKVFFVPLLTQIAPDSGAICFVFVDLYSKSQNERLLFYRLAENKNASSFERCISIFSNQSKQISVGDNRFTQSTQAATTTAQRASNWEQSIIPNKERKGL